MEQRSCRDKPARSAMFAQIMQSLYSGIARELRSLNTARSAKHPSDIPVVSTNGLQHQAITKTDCKHEANPTPSKKEDGGSRLRQNQSPRLYQLGSHGGKCLRINALHLYHLYIVLFLYPWFTTCP
jgi:hypothetical protein